MLLENLYFITSKEVNPAEKKATVEVRLSVSHPIFEGHFPDMPILPGVCQVQICSEILAQILQQEITLNEAISIKFLSFINPNETENFNVELNWDISESKVSLSAIIKSAEKTFLKLKANYSLLNE